MLRPFRLVPLALLAVASCVDDPPPPVVTPPPVAALVRKDEGHLPEVRQLTHGAELRSPSWAWDSRELVVEASKADECPEVRRITLTATPQVAPVARGEQPAFLPDGSIVFAARPCERKRESAGAIDVDPSSDVFRASPGGGSPTRLTDSPAYDGQPSVCRKSGAIVFTSSRDGDLDLYRMGPDGSGVQRITSIPGYDGDAVFDADCTHIAWRAWHPYGKETEAYAAQLAQHAIHAPFFDLWVANADGTEARQVTYFEARSSRPTFYPTEKRLLFASTLGGESARDVDLWAVDLDGTSLERISTAPGPDGEPAFSPDGQFLAFTSERGTALGRSDRNVFVAQWAATSRHVEERPADHLMGDCAWLADRAREGRVLGSKGLEDTAAYLERSFESFGLVGAGEEGFRQPFELVTRVNAAVTLSVAGVPVGGESVRALGFSSSSTVEAPLVYVAADTDFDRLDVKGRIVVVRSGPALRRASWVAREHGAAGFLAVTDGALPETQPDSSEGLVAAIASNAALSGWLSGLVRGQHLQARLAVTLAPETTSASNVVARWPAAGAARLPGVVVVGAHFDGASSESPGADDDASGTAALLQIGRSLGERKAALRRDVVLVGFSGEEGGAAGAAAFVQHPPAGIVARDISAMIDLDMVGRLRDDTLQIFGEDTAAEWPDLLSGACNAAHVTCLRATGGGVGGEDRRAFFEAGIPALHLFSGVHADYGKKTDTVDRLNAAGMAQVAAIAEAMARDAADLGGQLTFQRGAEAPGEGDTRGFGASLGTIPDRAGPPGGAIGMLLGGVRRGGPADKAGLRRGDLLVRLGRHVVGGIDDVKFVLTQSRPGTHLRAVVIREGKEVSVDVTLDAPGSR